MGKGSNILFCGKHYRILFAALFLSLFLAVPRSAHSISHFSRSKAAQILAGSCALMLLATHVDRVVYEVNHPVDVPEQFLLPVGAGKTRESFALMLARARGKKLKDGDFETGQPRVLPPVYEIAIRYQIEDFATEEVRSYVKEVVADTKHAAGFIVQFGEAAMFLIYKNGNRTHYQITDFDNRLLSSGFLID